MGKMELEHTLSDIKDGNELAREQLIRHYKPYIINTVGHICKRYVTWNDEEASIGLIAFNNAINTFDSEANRSFQSYVYLLIKRDLIDYYRREKRQNHLSLVQSQDEKSDTTQVEVDRSIDLFTRDIQTNALVEEILALEGALVPFNISFNELENYSPSHNDTRELLHQMVSVFIKDKECVRELLNKRRLPVTLFTRKTGYKAKTIERHRKYIITLIVVYMNPQWVCLSEYIKNSSRSEGKK